MACAVSAVGAKPPNVLFIAVDDLKPDFTAYGGEVPTPAIDRLAEHGTLFTNAHCQQAVCGPSRASLLTGLSPDHTQVWDLKTRIRDKRPDVVTLPQYFKENGYTAIGVGKIFDQRSVDKGEDSVSWSIPYVQPKELDYHPQYGKPAAYYQSPRIRKLVDEAEAAGHTSWRAVNLYLVERNAWPSVESEDVPDDAYVDGATTSYALNRLDDFAKSGEPFFLAVGFKKPHLPFVAPRKYWDMIDRDKIELAPFQQHAEGSPEYAYTNWGELRSYSGIPKNGPLEAEQQRELIHGYYACALYIDAQIGKLLDKVKALGLDGDTIVVLWGDHGWHLGDHGQWCKHTNYEQATRVPLIIAAPDFPGGNRTTEPVGLIDIYPTLCQLTGLPTPTGLDGVSLVPLMKDAAADVRDYVMSQYPRGDKMGYALRNDRYRLVSWFDTGDMRPADGSEAILQVELYDYEQDPLETRNLADDPSYRDVSRQLSAQMMAYLKDQNAQD